MIECNLKSKCSCQIHLASLCFDLQTSHQFVLQAVCQSQASFLASLSLSLRDQAIFCIIQDKESEVLDTGIKEAGSSLLQPPRGSLFRLASFWCNALLISVQGGGELHALSKPEKLEASQMCVICFPDGCA